MSVPWTAGFGAHTVWVAITAYGAYIESDYTNNRASRLFTVGDTVAPVADAGIGVTVQAGVDLVLDGTASHDTGGIASYTWHTSVDAAGTPLAGDTVLTGANPTLHGGYPAPGDYRVLLVVTDAAGNSGTTIVLVHVVAGADVTRPVAATGPAITVGVGQAFRLDGSASTDDYGVASYSWDLDVASDTNHDGITWNDHDLSGRSPLAPGYDHAADFRIRLTVWDAALNESLPVYLTVHVVDGRVSRSRSTASRTARPTRARSTRSCTRRRASPTRST